MIVRFTKEDLERWRVESQEPAGDLTLITVGDARICEGEGGYNGIADIHAHVTARWANGAMRREPIPLSREEQRDWLIENRPDLLADWETAKAGRGANSNLSAADGNHHGRRRT